MKNRNFNILRLFKMNIITVVKVKVLPIQATKALRVGRGIALPFLKPRH